MKTEFVVCLGASLAIVVMGCGQGERVEPREVGLGTNEAGAGDSRKGTKPPAQ